MKIKYLLPALITLNMYLLQGCSDDIIEMFPGGQPIPQETTNELIILGASLGTTNPRHKPLPDDIGAEFSSGFGSGSGTDFVFSGELALTIARIETQLNNDSGTYLYAFSQQLVDQFLLITNPKFSTPGEPFETVFVELFKSTSLTDNESALTGIADFTLGSNLFFVPFNATHLELRYAAPGNTDPVSIERWELTEFYAYNRYIKPIIDANQ